MTWPSVNVDPSVVDGILAKGADDLVTALREGTPVHSGRMRDSWRASGGLVSPTVPYAEFVAVDTSAAERVLEDIDNQIASAIDQQFGG